MGPQTVRHQTGLSDWITTFIWLHQIIVNSMWDLLWIRRDLSLQCVGSLIVVCELICRASCEISVPPTGMEPMSPALQGGFLTILPPGKSPSHFNVVTQAHWDLSTSFTTRGDRNFRALNSELYGTVYQLITPVVSEMPGTGGSFFTSLFLGVWSVWKTCDKENVGEALVSLMPQQAPQLL